MTGARTAALALLVLATAALLPTAVAGGNYTVSGSVYDESGDFINDAGIQYEYENGSVLSTSTSGGGFYELDPYDGEKVEITASKAGYEPESVTVRVDQDVEHDFDLEPDPTPTPTATATPTATPTTTATPTFNATTAASGGGGGPVQDGRDWTPIAAGVTALAGGGFGLWRWRG